MGKKTEKQKKEITSTLVREFSAGGVVYKKSINFITWLIIKPAGTDRWQLPKGRIENQESSQVAALREVAEEGGIQAKVVDKIGNQKYFFMADGKKIFKTVTFYLMEYLSKASQSHDWEVEKAEFLPFAEAISKLSFKGDRVILNQGKEILEQGIQTNLL